MATEAGTTEEVEGTEGSTGEESGSEQGKEKTTTPEEGANGEQSKPKDDGKLPDDHPVVKALAKLTTKSAQQATELTEARAQAAKVTKLEEDLKGRPTPEALTTLQTRYDRLEEFLQSVGGPLSKALDSRTFTKDLFETDKDIKTLVAAFERANPSATSQALGRAGSQQSSGKIDPNELIRIARGK